MVKHEHAKNSYLSEFIYGGIDGAITTVAVIAGAIGASLGAPVILILGFANLFADGFSMAASNYLSTRSENELAATHDHPHYDLKAPLPAALATFVSFVVVGFIPLAPFLLVPFAGFNGYVFATAAIATAFAFIVVGVVKGYITGKSKWRSALQTLLIGGVAAAIAFYVGYALNQWFGV